MALAKWYSSQYPSTLYRVFPFFMAFRTYAARTCYWPSGTVAVGTPCDPTAEVSMCCEKAEDCLTNGLCISDNGREKGSNISFARGTCTDQAWLSSICPQQCLKNPDSGIVPGAYDFSTNGVQVWECGQSKGYSTSASYCCESAAERTRCCSTSFAVFRLGPASIGNPSSSTPSSTRVTTSTSSVTSTNSSSASTTPLVATQTSTPKDPSSVSSAGLNIGARIGLGLGIPLGVAILAVFSYLFWRQRRGAPLTPSQGQVEGRYLGNITGHGVDGKPELDGGLRTELDGRAVTNQFNYNQIFELPVRDPA